MSNELIINASLPETRIALMEDGQIQELLIERASEKGIVGNIYKGRVTRVLPGMQAAFVDIGLDKAAFLYVDDVYVHSEVWEEDPGEVSEMSPIDPEQAKASDVDVSSEAAAEKDTEQSVEQPVEDQPTEDQRDQRLGLNEDDDEEEEDDDEIGEPTEMGPDRSKDSDEPESEDVASDDVIQAPEEEARSKEAEQSSSPTEEDPRLGLAATRAAAAAAMAAHATREAPSLESTADATAESRRSEDSSESPEGIEGDDTSRRHRRGNRGKRGGRFRKQTLHNTETAEPKQEHVPQTSRTRDRRIRPKSSTRVVRAQVNIQDLLKEGQEILVQVAKDPIATKGARLTCHISLPGRHLVCMPTIDHVGVSRRIEREDERRRLRDFVERNRPKNLGFIVRTASGKQQSEKRIKQDIEYLTRLWGEIKEKSVEVTAPSLVYEDLNVVLRAVRDWVTEEIDKVIVDSRYHYNEMLRFVSHFMPPMKQKVELYHGDIPIFDAYGISTELSRALERRVWLKSGGYIVIDQAEALVAIDVNTGRYVGKKNLEDTILKTNLEAVQEIAYQLRLRNCGGIIILDLIDMEKEENRQRVYRALEDALMKDRARPTIMKISELGLIEMTRKRTRDTIIRTLCESCYYCEGKGFIKSKQTVAYEVMREIEREGIERAVNKILVQAHPDVIDILAIDERESLDQLERRYRKAIYLQAAMDFHPEQFEVIADKEARVVKPLKEKKVISPNAQSSRSSMGSSSHREDGSSAPAPLPVPLSSPVSREGSGGKGGAKGGAKDRFKEHAKEAKQASRQDSREVRGSSGGPSPVMGEEVKQERSFRPDGGEEIAKEKTKAVADDFDEDSIGNRAPALLPVGNVSGEMSSYEEEDRLAFLRAQAAQDAALAQLSQGHGPAATTGGGRNHNNNNNRRRNQRGGRRGNHKFRRGMDRNRDRSGVNHAGHASSPEKSNSSDESGSGNGNLSNNI